MNSVFDPLDDFIALRNECAEILKTYSWDPESAHMQEDNLMEEAIDWMAQENCTTCERRRVAEILSELSTKTRDLKWFA